VILKLLARRLGIPEAGPERLRRSFLSFGSKVEFDHVQRIAVVYACPFSHASMQQGYEKLYTELNDAGLTLVRNGIDYRIQFCCQYTISEHGNNSTDAIVS